MVFVGFFLPLAAYLLVLAGINRRARPLFVSGPADLAGVLFAVSGFLVLGGPAMLGSLNERWRLFWLLSEGGSLEGIQDAWQFGVLLSLLYFSTVVIACCVLFRRSRQFTAIYNVEPSDAASCLADVCKLLGLDPVRSGNLYVFGETLPSGEPVAAEAARGGSGVVLALEPFAASKHVTLCWQPVDSPVRLAVETELERRLDEVGAPYHDTSLWLTTAGFGLLGLSLVLIFALVLRSVLPH